VDTKVYPCSRLTFDKARKQRDFATTFNSLALSMWAGRKAQTTSTSTAFMLEETPLHRGKISAFQNLGIQYRFPRTSKRQCKRAMITANILATTISVLNTFDPAFGNVNITFTLPLS